MTTQTPLVYFHGLVPGRYLPAWPVFIEGDDPSTLTFTVRVDDVEAWQHRLASVAKGGIAKDDGEGPRRAYITASVRQRLHQQAFRSRVLSGLDRLLVCEVGSALVVTHKGVIRTIVEKLCGQKIEAAQPELGGVIQVNRGPDGEWSCAG